MHYAINKADHTLIAHSDKLSVIQKAIVSEALKQAKELDVIVVNDSYEGYQPVLYNSRRLIAKISREQLLEEQKTLIAAREKEAALKAAAAEREAKAAAAKEEVKPVVAPPAATGSLKVRKKVEVDS